MSSQRYQRVNAHDDEEAPQSQSSIPLRTNPTPSSPPPSFRSRSSSPSTRRLLRDDPNDNGAEETLAAAFGDGSDSEVDDEPDDRQRLMRAQPESQPIADSNTIASASSSGAGSGSQSSRERIPAMQRRPTILPSFNGSSSGPGRMISSSNDGVFANLAAKPERGEKNEDMPPSYEEAAADATPPYWETTILAPGIASDEVYVDGLPVGSVFSFVWNAMISMSFQLVGFLLTYLLHTTHAAKNGSRAGLGLTLVQYGFYMKGGSESRGGEEGSDQYATPSDPNSHNFDPNSVNESSGGDGGSAAGISTSDWISYILMIVGWFILIRAISDFLRARRHEQLVLQSPDRGLGVPVIAEGERSETVV
ncbi:metal homeostatis BSD2 family protein [Aspergillus affinis]|uniref:metal homeostatis BSD2 family protein n=1 Tax=Aspergillus affinis TaxID=1070780 RepID=UPI0022FE1047|nr:metal homeostatis protein Bsd2 [Aspergillus affinis]KAI9038577.1 metal homeostatis protein Bsd2 [Aspergillus affinis]